MIGPLWKSFGVVGALSITAWAAALVLLVALVVIRRRERFIYGAGLFLAATFTVVGMQVAKSIDFGYPATAAWCGVGLIALVGLASRRWTALHWTALALATVALVLATISSASISEIKVDRSEELRAAAERRRKERQEELAGSREGIDIALPEDTAAEKYDIAGIEGEEARELLPDQAPEGRDAQGEGDEPAYAYREKGPGERTGDVRRERTEEEKKILAERQAEQPTDDAEPALALPPGQIADINAFDRANLFAARSMVWIAVLVVLMDFVRQTNRTFGSYWTLPISGRTLDQLSPKTHSVYLQTHDPQAIRAYLRNLVRKGETFIFAADDDPLPEDRIPRLGIGDRGLALDLPKLVYGPGEMPVGCEFLFEGAWFGRYAFVVRGSEFATSLLDPLVDYLHTRRTSGARAHQTVHLVWNLAEPIPVETLDELAFLGHETNVKLVVVRPDPPSAETLERFEEAYEVAGDTATPIGSARR